MVFGGAALTVPLTGVGQYSFQLASRLARDPALDMLFFYGREFGREVRAGGSPRVLRSRRWVRDIVPNVYTMQRWLRQRRFDAGMRAGQFDLYHEPNFLPLRFDGPIVLTVHDLSWVRYPQTHPAERVRDMDRYFEPGLRRATLVLTVSEFVRRELIEVFGLAPQRVLAIPNGLDPVFRPMPAPATRDVLAAHGLSHGAYFLSLGTLEPRKNIETTLRAYARLPQELRQRLPLVLAGMKGWRTSAIDSVMAPLLASGQVRLLGFVEREALAAVTAGALALVYPSLYEGFGLPPLEAMGCGVPAIVSNVSSLPEVVGDAGIQVAPMDDAQLADAMRGLAEDAGLRARLSLRSLERAAAFTWDRCAAETKAAYARALVG
ncbi:hypothetical protein UC35_14350 [Ramlibacter tataouinensis]|uniref:Uncharacterized protein n=1 Tax=Ramlibacter tataouinensis TaxID=94132 RepID=A0A127JZV8_9BURK|nr:hypothetical protein UC35_14350 [Ramlibacter tataouinensis]